MAGAHKSDDEVIQILRAHGVPEDMSLRSAWATARQRLPAIWARNHKAGITKQVGPTHVLEEMAKEYGFKQWRILERLLKRRKQILRRRASAPADPNADAARTEQQPEDQGENPVVVPEGLSPAQLKYIKQLGWRKCEVVGITQCGKAIEVTHQTATGSRMVYQVPQNGQAKYLRVDLPDQD